jgi:putative membrane protein
MTTYERVLLGLLLVLAAASCVGAPYPTQMYLQHAPTVAAIALLPCLAKARLLGPLAFTCVVAFMLLHVLGARYIYSYVPYDQWSVRVIGGWHHRPIRVQSKSL